MSVFLDREFFSHGDLATSWTSGPPRRRWRPQFSAPLGEIYQEREREQVRDRAEGKSQSPRYKQEKLQYGDGGRKGGEKG